MKAITAVGAGIVVMLIGCSGVSADDQPRIADAIPVKLAPVVDAEYAEPVTGTGTLTTRDEFQLGFKVGGIVASIVAEEGTFVRKGQLLATLDLREINAQLEKARTALEKAERDLARVRNLHRDSVATLESLQNATSILEMARSDYSAVAFNQRYATILAPTDGVVLKKFTESGQVVAPGAPVVLFGSLSSGSVVKLGVADRDIARLRKGDAAEVRFSAYPDRVFSGVVNEIPSAADAHTGTYMLEIKLAETPPIASGLVGAVTISPTMRGTVRMVPIESVIEADGNRGHVFVLDGDVARLVPVTIASIADRHVALSGGLNDEAQVVTAGAAYLSEGAKVKVMQ